MRYKQKIRLHYEIKGSMSTPTRNRGLVFYPSLSLVNEDHDKEYLLTKFKQFSSCDFIEIPNKKEEASQQTSNQASKHLSQ